MTGVVCVTTGPAATEEIGRVLATVLQPGDLVALDGDLGAGKTVLVRGLAMGLGVDALTVRSPTFVLHHVYPAERLTLHHIDCYRLGPGADLRLLDLDDLLEDGAVAMEWAELAATSHTPALRVRFEILDEDRRALHIEGARFVAALAAGSAAQAEGASL